MLGLPKRTPYRNEKLLAMCREENGECLVNLPGCKGWGATVPAHSNRADDGKGKSQKADDCFVAKACQHCHDVLDGRNSRPKVRDHVPMLGVIDRPMTDEEVEWYHDRGIKRTLRLALDKGVLK